MPCRRCYSYLLLSGVCRSSKRHLTHLSVPFSKRKNAFTLSSFTSQQGHRFFHQRPTSTAILSTSNDAILTPHALLLAAKTRSALEEATEKFLCCECRRLYSIYRPSVNIDIRMSSPDEYIRVIQKLSASGLAEDGKKVYFVLVELLKKPVHPSQAGGSWDLPNNAIEKLQASALEALMCGLEGGEALSFAWNSLMAPPLSPGTPLFGETNVSKSAANEMDSLFYTLSECLRSDTMSIMRGKSKEGSAGYRIIRTPEFVCAVVMALIRLNTNSSKLQAIEILQRASIARLRGLSVFDENVAVKCAEAAAVIGDAETLTRIIFILYRARGVLTSETDSGRLEMENSNLACNSKTLWGRVVAHLGGRQWITENSTDNVQNEAFHRASLRLLKSVIHAALQSSTNGKGTEKNNSMHEALRLFQSLRVGCHWGGIASMAVELLTYMKSDAQRLYTFLASDSAENTWKQLSGVQCEAQKVVAVLRDSLPCKPSPYQQSTYSSCVALAAGCYLVHVCISIDHQSIAVPIMGIPLHLSSMEQREYMASVASSVLFLYDTMDSEHKLQNLHILLAASVAALASKMTLHNSLDRILGRFEEVFLRGGSPQECPKGLMQYYSSIDEKNTLGALWLWNALVFSDKYSGSATAGSLFPIMMGTSVTEWMLSALPRQREILWSLLTKRECHQMISLHTNTVVHAVEQVLETAVSQHEIICMIRLIYSQFKYNCESHPSGRTLVNRLLSCLLNTHVLTTEPEDIIMAGASHLMAHHENDKAIVVVGAHDMRLAYEKKLNFSDWLKSMAKNGLSPGIFPDHGSSSVVPSVVLTIDAVLFMINRRGKDNDDTFVQQMDDVLRWLQPSPRDAAATTTTTIPTATLPQLFLLAPFSQIQDRMSITRAREKEEVLTNVKFKDGVEESCAIARAVANAPLRSVLASRLVVYLWDNEDSESASTTERRTLLRNGVKLLSSRRVRTRRASADVKQILQAPPSCEALDARHRCGRQFLFSHPRRADDTAAAAPSRSSKKKEKSGCHLTQGYGMVESLALRNGHIT